MAIIHQVMVEVLDVVERGLQGRGLDGTQSTSVHADATPTPSSSPTLTSAAPTMSTSTSSGGNGPTSSPLLFFVALGFGVVFTNLWIIVGVKYCFRYNARNRARQNGEEANPINLENMPARPHRRRREKKLMTMDEVNERFPLTKYKTWVAARELEGLPTAGGVTASPSRAGSVRNVDGVIPSSPVETKESVFTRPPTAASENNPPAPTIVGDYGNDKKSMDAHTAEKGPGSPTVEEQNHLEEIQTTASTVNKQATATSEEEDDDDDDHIHTAVPPELLTNPGDSCAICIDTLEEDDDIRGLTCGHAFHAGCLDPWLTSRRACCPLCKADYYTPKPRPEGEPAEPERAGRRSGRTTQAPPSGWTGIRGSPRLILPGRFLAHAGDATIGNSNRDARRTAHRDAVRRERRERETATQHSVVMAVVDESNGQAASNRWRPNISNPFRNMRTPTIFSAPGRARIGGPWQRGNAPSPPSPSQLEAGVQR